MTLPPAAQRDLKRAVGLLEQPRLAVRVANLAAKPLDGVLGALPKVNDRVQDILRKAILQCLTVAIESQGDETFVPSAWRPKALTGLTGGIGGIFGAIALPIELPLTTTLMLRAIVEIARHHGENLVSLEPRLACLQVFGLGNRRTDAGAVVGYYAARRTLSKLTAELVAGVVERSMLDASAPVVTRMVSEIVSRFGLVWSERFAAGAVPVLGALGGASLNMIFMDHFERVAQGHFIIRRLERDYGFETIHGHYGIAASAAARRPRLSPPA
jgi:hypothetical protein